MKALLAAALIATSPVHDPDPWTAAAVGAAVPLVLGLSTVTIYQLDHYGTQRQVAFGGQLAAISFPLAAGVGQAYAGKEGPPVEALGLSLAFVAAAYYFSQNTTTTAGCLAGPGTCDVVPDHLAWVSMGGLIALASLASGAGAYWAAAKHQQVKP